MFRFNFAELATPSNAGKVREMLNDRLKKTKMPDFIDQVRIKWLDFGSLAPVLKVSDISHLMSFI